MSKVLLIFEDYTELNTLQFTLKKVGFDCIGISTEFGTSEQVISFNPDIVIASGKGPKVSTVGVGRRLKEMPRWTGKAVLIFASGFKPKPEDLMKIRMDVVLEAPVENVRLIQVLAKLTNQDDQVLIEKLIKSMAQENTIKEASFIVGSNKSTSDKVYVGGNIDSKKSDENFVMNLGAEKQSDTKVSSTPKKSSSEAINLKDSLSPEKVLTPSESVSPTATSSSSAFEDLNRREKAKGRFRPQFSLTPEEDPENISEPRFGNLNDKKIEASTQVEFERKIDEIINDRIVAQPQSLTEETSQNLKDTTTLPVDKQDVDWSELEKQLFSQPQDTKIETSDTDMTQQAVSGDAQASKIEDASHFSSGAKDTPLNHLGGPNLEQQIRKAAKDLPLKMTNYRQMAQVLKVPKESTLKKTNSRKVQIELMKDWKQVELEKQDGLRREFTKALFKKK